MSVDNHICKMILKCLFLLFTATTCFGEYRCSSGRMTQCRDGLEQNMGRRISEVNRQEMRSHCANTRDDFNCLLKETRCLTRNERQRNSDILRNAVRYIKDGCDTQGGSWKDSSCFLGSDIKNCENSNPLGGSSFSSFTSDSCRKYQQFSDCVDGVVRSRCNQDAEKLLGLYLMDTARDLAWNCSESDYDSDRDSRRYGSDRYGGSSDRYGGSSDRYGDRSGGSSDRYGGSSDRYGGSSDRDRYGGSSDRYGGSSNRNYDRGYDRYDRNHDSYGSNGASDITCCRYERCDRNRMQQCRDSLSRTVENRMTGYQDQQKCRKARDDYNCLLWQNSCLTGDEKDRNNDIFHRAKDYFTKSCDTFGRWNENSCYKTTEMQRCENQLSNTRSGADYEACRSYNRFRECVTQELQNRCTREDELLQGSYMVEKAQEMAWMCNHDQMDDRNVYYPGDRRNQYDRRNDYPPYGPTDDSPPHLDDDDVDCKMRVQPEADVCENKLRETRRQLLTESNYDIKQKKTCCSARDYQSCLGSATQRVCKQYRRRVVESLLGRYQFELRSSNCLRVYESDCSSCSHIVAIFSHVFVGVVFAFFIRHFF